MKQWLQRVMQAWQKARELPYLGRGSFAVIITLLIISMLMGWHRTHPDDAVDAAVQQAQQSQMDVPEGILVLARVLPYLNLWIRLGVPVLLIVIWRRWGDLRRLMFPVSVASVSLAVWAIASDLVDYIAHSHMTEIGEPPVPVAFAFKLVFIALVFLSAPFALHYYRRIGILERYTLRTFLHPLVFCFVSFFTLWIIMDLLDNMKDFQESKSGAVRVITFYLGMIPFVYTQILPVALLLAVLYSLTRMSKANELISMLGTGQSLSRVLRPIFVCSVYACMLDMAANYYWAPRAEGNREAVFRAMSVHAADSIMASAIMFHDEQTRRTWYVATFPFSMRSGQERMHGVQIREEDAQGQPRRTIIAPAVGWSPRAGWRFYDGKEWIYKNGSAADIRSFPEDKNGQRVLEVAGIEETPWSLVSYALRPDFMSVPELVSYLRAHPKAADDKLAPFRTHLWHRFALPWQAMALVLVAAPLGVAYSRRGSVGGIAGSVFIFFIFMFMNNLFLNLGKGGHLPPWLTVWMPHLLFGTLGAVLFHYRSQNRDLPTFTLRLFKKKAAQIARPRNRSAAVPGASAT
ncbi:LptF/LptG family permease [Prosthecobacter sp.]|uniref:LptF/LptG family permease n=1 Tax=Prosthecobacter sp. TaxID=1965333 RepID=UPI003782F98E